MKDEDSRKTEDEVGKASEEDSRQRLKAKAKRGTKEEAEQKVSEEVKKELKEEGPRLRSEEEAWQGSGEKSRKGLDEEDRKDLQGKKTHTIPEVRKKILGIRTHLNINKTGWTKLVRDKRRMVNSRPCVPCDTGCSDAKHDRACLDFQLSLAKEVQSSPVLLEPLLAERQEALRMKEKEVLLKREARKNKTRCEKEERVRKRIRKAEIAQEASKKKKKREQEDPAERLETTGGKEI